MRIIVSAPPTVDAGQVRVVQAQSLPVIPDRARALVNRWGYQTLYEVPQPLQLRLRISILDSHLEDLASTVDGCWHESAFSMLADWMRWSWSHTSTSQWQAVLDTAAECVRLYDRIVHVPTGPRPAYDGYCWLDARNGMQQERLLRNLYAEFECESRVTLADRE